MKRGTTTVPNEINKSTQWLRFLICAALVNTITSDITCPLNCTCADGIDFEIECDYNGGYFEVSVSRDPLRLSLTCYGPTPSCNVLTNLQTALPPLTTNSLELRNCLLPANESFLCVSTSLGIDNLKSLEVSGLTSPGSFSRLYMYGLDTVSELALLDMSEISPTLLKSIPHPLRRLVIRKSNIILGPDMFSSSSALEYLELSSNEIKNLPPSIFRGLSKLRVLSLWGNSIVTISPGALEGLDSLEHLDLSSNSLRVIRAKDLAGAVNLKTINLVGVPLERMELNGLRHLEEVIVVDCRAELMLNKSALSLNTLRSVRIERCRVKELPADVLRGAVNLQELSLTRNKIQHLPLGLLQDATALRRLDVSNNQIASLNAKFFVPLAKLEELVLDDNPIGEFPPEVFSGLTNAEHISCARCSVKVIGRHAFSFRLRRLDLTANQLTEMPAVPSLSELNLSANRIAEISDDWRLVMTQLWKLNLSHNIISSIREAELDFLALNLEIDLRYNNITSIELRDRIDQTDENQNILLLWIDYNPFSCDCKLLELVRAVSNSKSNLRLNAKYATCATPSNLANISLSDLPLSELECKLPTSCPESCDCTLRPAASELFVTCSNWPLGTSLPNPGDYGLNSTSLRINSLSSIRLSDLPPHVLHLNLSSLNLTEVPSTPAPSTLQSMDLSKNKLKRAPLELLRLSEQTNFFLAGNPLECSCTYAGDVRALQEVESRVADAELLRCASGSFIQRLDTARLCAARMAWIAATLGACVAAIALVVGALALRRLGLPLRVWLHARGWLPEWMEAEEDDGDKTYDVFVSFSHADTALVTEKLVPGLEAAGLRVCVHYRDWAPGELIPDQIVKSVAAARRTIVVLSRAFLASEWARAEFRAAHVRALKEGKARVVALLAEEIKVLLADAKLDADLRGYLASNTYLEVADAWFWDKLRYALRKRRSAPPSLPVKLAVFGNRIGACGESVW